MLIWLCFQFYPKDITNWDIIPHLYLWSSIYSQCEAFVTFSIIIMVKTHYSRRCCHISTRAILHWSLQSWIWGLELCWSFAIEILAFLAQMNWELWYSLIVNPIIKEKQNYKLEAQLWSRLQEPVPVTWNSASGRVCIQ